MQAHDLEHDIDPIRVARLVNQLQPREMCFLRHSFTSEAATSVLHFALKQSSAVFITVTEGELTEYQDAINELAVRGLAGICVMSKTSPEKYANRFIESHVDSGDLRIIELHSKAKALFGEKLEIVFEFSVEKDMRILGATIDRLHKAGVPWIHFRLTAEPTVDEIKKMRDLFEFLRMRECFYLNVYFDLSSEFRHSWQIKTMNTFSGLTDVHIDLSNKCTHSCVFCGLYSPVARQLSAEKAGGKLDKYMTDLMRMEASAEKTLGILQSLPCDVQSLQFGGIGDPLMHPQAVDFMVLARERGFKVEVLSNMEYLEPADIEKLTKLGGKTGTEIRFIANISGGTYEQYKLTRPLQTEKAYEKVSRNVRLQKKKKKENNGVGAHVTLMYVINKLNIDGIAGIADLAIDLEVDDIWFKPMELHGDYTWKVMPDPKSDAAKVATNLRTAVEVLDKRKIKIFDRESCEQIIRESRF